MRLHSLGLTARVAPTLELAAGKLPFRLGRGDLGNLLLGRSAPPTWQLRAIYGVPPGDPAGEGPRGHLGVRSLLAYLDDEKRRIPRPLLLVQDVTIAPLSWFAVTAARTILFGGEGRTSRLTGRDLLNILGGRRENVAGRRGPGDSDQKASVTGYLLLPRARGPLEDGRLFYEYAGEDWLHGPLPSARGRHLGAKVRWSGVTLTAEHASTHSGANRWYDHTIYGPFAYSYRGYPLGLAQGGDARSTLVGAAIPTRGGRVLGLSLLAQEFGIHSGTHERRTTAAVSLDLPVLRATALRIEASGTSRGRGREPRAPEPLLGAVSATLTWRGSR